MTARLLHPQVHEAPQWKVSNRETFAVPGDGPSADTRARPNGNGTTGHGPSSQSALSARVFALVPDHAGPNLIEVEAESLEGIEPSFPKGIFTPGKQIAREPTEGSAGAVGQSQAEPMTQSDRRFGQTSLRPIRPHSHLGAATKDVTGNLTRPPVATPIAAAVTQINTVVSNETQAVDMHASADAAAPATAAPDVAFLHRSSPLCHEPPPGET